MRRRFWEVESFSPSWPIRTLQQAISTQTLPSHALGLVGLHGATSWGFCKYPLCPTTSLTCGQDYWGLFLSANFMGYIQWLLSITSYISWVNIQHILIGYRLSSNYYLNIKRQKDGCREPCKWHNPCPVEVYNLVGMGGQDGLGSNSGYQGTSERTFAFRLRITLLVHGVKHAQPVLQVKTQGQGQ